MIRQLQLAGRARSAGSPNRLKRFRQDARTIECCRMCQLIGQKQLVMNDWIVGRCTATHTQNMHYVCTAILLAAVLGLVFTPQALARRTGQVMVPPPPPTPMLEVPPPPVMLPYYEAYSNYEVAPRMSMPQVETFCAIQTTPNRTGLNQSTATLRGFGKPRNSYVNQPGPGAASACGPSMSGSFNSSVRRNSNRPVSYSALDNRSPFWLSAAANSTGRPELITNPLYAEFDQPTSLASSVRRFRQPKRIIAKR